VASFIQQSNAVIGHLLKGRIWNSELRIFEGCAHAPIYENVEEFNQTTLQFLKRHSG
jgi:pimeloyl-ACP methyl ester carboxylesterase